VTDPRIATIREALNDAVARAGTQGQFRQQYVDASEAFYALERELADLRAEREKELAHRRDQDERWQAASKKWSQEITELRAENEVLWRRLHIFVDQTDNLVLVRGELQDTEARLSHVTEALQLMLDAHACDLNTSEGECCGECVNAREVRPTP
jgi:predicted nuclease with TOPRIM domain